MKGIQGRHGCNPEGLPQAYVFSAWFPVLGGAISRTVDPLGGGAMMAEVGHRCGTLKVISAPELGLMPPSSKHHHASPTPMGWNPQKLWIRMNLCSIISFGYFGHSDTEVTNMISNLIYTHKKYKAQIMLAFMAYCFHLICLKSCFVP